jgi:hypothetical protein
MNEEKINLSPKVFISYSRGTEQYDDRVLKLAGELVENGIDVKIDKWDIQPGQNLHKFMEEMVNNNDINKVLVICNKLYADKANDRKGGVGIETDIIAPKVYGNPQNTKFIPVVFEKDENGDAYLPAYFKPDCYINLCLDNDKYSEEFEKLIRLIIEKSEYTKPKLGKIPTYILEEDKRGQTSASVRALRVAFENDKNVVPKLKSYCDVFVANLDNFIIQNKSNTSIEDEKKNFLKKLNDFTTHRDEYLEIMEKAAKYDLQEQELESVIYSFFEKLLLYKKDKSKEYGTENIEFIIYELFLYTVGILIKEERFDTVAELLKREFVESDNYGKQKKMFEKTYFNGDGRVFEALKQRKDGRRYVNYAVTYMMNKINSNILSKLELIDADVLIYLKVLIEQKIHKQSLYWYPLTKICLADTDKSPLFIRCASIDYTKKVDVIFRYSMLKDFKEISEKKLLVLPCEYPWLENIISDYINISSLGTRE